MIATPLRADGRCIYDANGELLANCSKPGVAASIVALVNAAALT